jgi:perosamine synthetase
MFIPYSTQWIDDDDISAVKKALRAEYLTQGPKIAEFEKAVAKYCGAKYAVALNSGTAALHAACNAAGITKGDEVITSPITFVASANCALYCGGTPVFAEIDKKLPLITADTIKKKITKRTKAIIPVDYSGHPCDMDAIRRLAKKNGLVLIEDAAHSFGATYKNKKVGSLADMTILSFHAVKHITTGEGGMLLTDNKRYYEKAMMFRSHGITRQCKGDGPWYYEMQSLGYNYRITDFQCALGLSQLKKLNKFVALRRKIASYYTNTLTDIEGIELPKEISGSKSSYHLYPIRLKGSLIKNKVRIFNDLRAGGLGVNVHYIPVHLQPYYKKTFGHKKGDYPNAESFYMSELSIPIHQKMTINDAKYVVKTLRSVITKWNKQ